MAKDKWDLSPKEVELLQQHDHLIDAAQGGYLLGPSHAQGGITLVVKRGYRFHVVFEVEGGEYLIGAGAYAAHKERILEINLEGRSMTFENRPVPNWCMKIDARPRLRVFVSRYLLLPFGPEFFILNRVATERHLHWVDRINRQHPPTT